jgi:hypothetical protein
MDIQKQVRDNSQVLQNYISGLYEWEDGIKKKDKELKQAPKPQRVLKHLDND